jgi:hypothetical protein
MKTLINKIRMLHEMSDENSASEHNFVYFNVGTKEGNQKYFRLGVNAAKNETVCAFIEKFQ